MNRDNIPAARENGAFENPTVEVFYAIIQDQ
jgi:hypothetical protein